MHKAALCLVVPMMLVATFAFSQTSSIQLSISQPENGDVVPRRLNVSGTSAGLGTNKIVLFVYSPPAKRWFFQGPPRISRKLSGISDLLAPDGTFIHPRAAERTKFCSAYNRPAPESVTSAHADVEPTGAAAFRAFLRHRSTLVPFLRQPSLHSAARQPAGTGSAQILRSISPKSRRFR